MFINKNFPDLKSKLDQFKQEKTKIEQKLETAQPSQNGIVNFGFYQLKKQKASIQSQITKINSIINPDIIA